MPYPTPGSLARPSADIRLRTNFEECQSCAPATVHDKANLGKSVRYYLRFDDDVVSGGSQTCHLPQCSMMLLVAIGTAQVGVVLAGQSLRFDQ